MSLNICSDGHDEVCYEGNVCPACDLKEDYEDQIEVLQNQLREAQEE